jgi:hypothetical protein
MRTIDKSRKKKPRRKILIVLIFIPLVLLASFIGIFVFMVEDLKSVVYQTPDTKYFISENEIDMPSLRVLANKFEHRQNDFHIPNNLSHTITINTTSQQVRTYHGSDNGALHTSENLIAACFRYASLEPGVEKNHALEMIEKMFFAIRLLIEIPNGGLGPDYPGASIGRYYASPQMLQDGNYTWMMEDYYRHRNGTGKYSQWRIRLYTSKDEIAGVIGAMAAVQVLVNVTSIQNVNNLLISQLVNGFIETNWQFISGDGKPNGVHFNPPSEPQWRLSLLKMAVNSFPENGRYNQLYNYYLNRELSVSNMGAQGDFDSIDNYYGLYFGSHVILAMMLVENSPAVIKKYFTNLDDCFSSFIGHRNAYLNVVYLAVYAKCLSLNPDTTSSYSIKNLIWDVKDQLWRFEKYGLFPFDESYGNRNKTISRTEKDPNGVNWTIKDPEVQKWDDFVRKNAFGNLYEGFIDELIGGILDERYIMPATVEMMSGSDIIWNRSPFRESGVHSSGGVVVNEYASASFSLPYWILTYYGLISEVNEK